MQIIVFINQNNYIYTYIVLELFAFRQDFYPKIFCKFDFAVLNIYIAVIIKLLIVVNNIIGFFPYFARISCTLST